MTMNLAQADFAYPIHRQSSNGPLRAVVLGIGGQGQRRARAIQLAHGWRLVGVHDIDDSAARAAAKRLGCPVWPDARSAIEDTRADLVVIATPPGTHDAHIAAALNADRHILCEKPLCLSPGPAFDFAAEAKRRGLLFATGFNHRFYGPVAQAHGLIESGRLGAIRKVQAFIGHPPSEAALNGWLGDPARSGGGVVVDNGSHLIDLLRLFLGELEDVTLDHFRWHPARPGIDTMARFRCRGQSGALAEAVCSWEEPSRPYLETQIEFERGNARFAAFPWTSAIVEAGGRRHERSWWPDRLAAKCLGFRAPGLEPSLFRELRAIRHVLTGQLSDSAQPAFATAFDGASVAAIVETVMNQAGAPRARLRLRDEQGPPAAERLCA